MKLKELRDKKGITQKEVALEIGCTARAYARYERGEREPDIETLKRLSKVFNTTIDFIVENCI